MLVAFVVQWLRPPTLSGYVGSNPTEITRDPGSNPGLGAPFLLMLVALSQYDAIY